MGVLFDHGLVSSPNLKASSVFEQLFSPLDFTEITYNTPNEYVNKYWSEYKSASDDSNLNGSIFEYIIETLLIRENILPFYTQASMSFVPGVQFDVLLYAEDEYGPLPFLLSLKTSFRERWKQADLEAEVMKNVHRRAKCFLLTVTPKDAQDVKKRILSGEAIALDDAIDCTSDEINDLITKLKSHSFIESEPNIKAVKSGHFINT